jgi:hypothetical protein
MGRFANDFTGQITGSAYCDAASAITPPEGKVIIAIYFIADNILTGLVAEDPEMYVNTAQKAHEQDNAGSNSQDHGDGGLQLSGASFPAGTMLYGRYTSVTPTADADGGIIAYFGE